MKKVQYKLESYMRDGKTDKNYTKMNINVDKGYITCYYRQVKVLTKTNNEYNKVTKERKEKMTYQKPQVEVIRFEVNNCFMTSSSIVNSYGNANEARNAAIAAMGWGQNDSIIAQGSGSNWTVYCVVVNGQAGYAGQYMCTSF